jgi:hypothetical protein
MLSTIVIIMDNRPRWGIQKLEGIRQYAPATRKGTEHLLHAWDYFRFVRPLNEARTLQEEAGRWMNDAVGVERYTERPYIVSRLQSHHAMMEAARLVLQARNYYAADTRHQDGGVRTANTELFDSVIVDHLIAARRALVSYELDNVDSINEWAIRQGFGTDIARLTWQRAAEQVARITEYNPLIMEVWVGTAQKGSAPGKNAYFFEYLSRVFETSTEEDMESMRRRACAGMCLIERGASRRMTLEAIVSIARLSDRLEREGRVDMGLVNALDEYYQKAMWRKSKIGELRNSMREMAEHAEALARTIEGNSTHWKLIGIVGEYRRAVEPVQ